MEELVTKDSTQSSACWQAMEEMARRHIERTGSGVVPSGCDEQLVRGVLHQAGSTMPSTVARPRSGANSTSRPLPGRAGRPRTRRRR